MVLLTDRERGRLTDTIWRLRVDGSLSGEEALLLAIFPPKAFIEAVLDERAERGA